MTILVTRFHGLRAVAEHVPTTLGPLWIGELRSDADDPLPVHGAGRATIVNEVRVAPELGDLLRVLERVAYGVDIVPPAALRRSELHAARVDASQAVR